MTRIPDPQLDADVTLVRRALQAYHRAAYRARWGGWYKHWQGAKQALEALDRIEDALTPQQASLFAETEKRRRQAPGAG
jgi:hypothetical protein